MRRLLLTSILLAAGLAPAQASAGGKGKVFLTRDEALALAFPACSVEKRTRYLTAEQKKRAEKLGDVDVTRGVVHAYVATDKKGKLAGTAYFDVNKVRTHKQIVMFVVTPEDKIGRIELLSFAEPVEYVPRASWYAQFVGRKLDDELSLKRGIRGVTGATLTARATTDAARRVLALHAVADLESRR